MVLIILRETKGEKFMHLHYKRDYICCMRGVKKEKIVSAHNSHLFAIHSFIIIISCNNRERTKKCETSAGSRKLSKARVLPVKKQLSHAYSELRQSSKQYSNQKDFHSYADSSFSPQRWAKLFQLKKESSGKIEIKNFSFRKGRDNEILNLNQG